MADFLSSIFGDKKSDKSLSDLVVDRGGPKQPENDFARIKANVQKMVDGRAPEADIDGYLATEGMTPDVFAARVKQTQPLDYGNDTLNMIVNGVESVMSPLEAVGDAGSDMMTLGKMDEILAGGKAGVDALFNGVPFKEAYANEEKRLRTDREAMEAEHPVASTVGKIAGVVANPGTKVGANFVNKGAAPLERGVRAMLPGGIEGTVAGAEGDTLAERGEGAAYGGAIGTVLAPVAQVGGEFAGSLLSKAFNFIRGRGKTALPSVTAGAIDDPVTASVMKQPGSQEVSRADMEGAARELWRRLEADGRDPAKVFQAIQSGQMDERTLASVGGENVKQMIDTAASMPGRAKEIVAGARLAEEQAQSPAILKSAAQNLGVKQSYTDLDDLMQAQKGAAGPFYDEFYAISPDRLDTPFMQNLLKQPLSKELLASARLLNQIEKASGKTPDDVFQYLLDSEGNVSVKQTLNPRAADYVKRALDNKVQEHIDPMTGKIKGGIGRAWDELRRAYLADVKKSAPEYGRALDAFSGPASMQDAMKVGRDILKDDWIANRKVIEEMTKSEKQAGQVGLFQAIDDLLSGISNKADKAKRLTDIDKYLKRARPLFDSEEAFDAFKKSLTGQSREFQAVQMAGKGSQSIPRLADEALSADAAVDLTRAGGGDLTTIMRGVRALLNRMGSAGEGQRAAQAALALTPARQALPYMSAVKRNADPRALGLLMMGATPLPAGEARGLLAPQ